MSRVGTEYLISHVHVITGDGTQIHDADVRLKNGRIAEVAQKRLPAAHAEAIDGRGKTLMPGLIDSHVHLDFLKVRNGLHGRLWARSGLKSALRELIEHGITSVRCMGDPLHLVTRVRTRLKSRPADGPRMVIAGPVLTAPGGHPVVTVAAENKWLSKHLAVELDNPADARAAVRRLHNKGVNVIKLVYQGGRYGETGVTLGKLTGDVMAAIIDEARAVGLPVSAHTHHQDDVDTLLSVGIHAFEHGILEEDIVGGETLARWAESGTWLIPTLNIVALVRDWEGRNHLATAAANLLRVYRAGVRIAAGTDSMIGALPATSLHEELRLMVDAGLPADDVLRMATGDAARSIGLPDHGLVGPGRVADLVLLNSNPAEQIENIGDIAMVFRDGRLVHHVESPKPLDLAPYRPGPGPVTEYVDDTKNTIDGTARVTYDTTGFDTDRIRRIEYADAASGRVLRTETVTSAPDLQTTRWTCDVPDEDTALLAERNGPNVNLSGRFNGEDVSRTYPLRGRAWMQTFLFDAAVFVISPPQRLLFVSIGTRGRGALAMTEFELTETGRETLDGRECVSTRLVMPQWRRFWAALGWYDVQSGELVQSHTKGKGNECLSRAS